MCVHSCLFVCACGVYLCARACLADKTGNTEQGKFIFSNKETRHTLPPGDLTIPHRSGDHHPSLHLVRCQTAARYRSPSGRCSRCRWVKKKKTGFAALDRIDVVMEHSTTAATTPIAHQGIRNRILTFQIMKKAPPPFSPHISPPHGLSTSKRAYDRAKREPLPRLRREQQ